VVLPREAPAAGDIPAVSLPTAMVAAPPPFEMSTVLRPEVITAMLAVAEEAAPAAKAMLAEARQGKYSSAGLAAFDAGHQELASFLRALDLLGKGQVEKAAALLNGAAGPRREYFPAAFYLGACFAAVGRDRDAAGVWQLALGTTPRPAFVYPLIADARLRDGHPEAVVPVLQAAYQRWPEDDAITKRLALAYSMSGQHGEAVPVLDAYLARHPGDQEALFAAVLSLYESGAGRALSEADHAKLTRYATAYRGPQKALVSKYVETMQKR
jgi:tetratricopeptide (TPR) repeat protein